MAYLDALHYSTASFLHNNHRIRASPVAVHTRASSSICTASTRYHRRNHHRALSAPSKYHSFISGHMPIGNQPLATQGKQCIHHMYLPDAFFHRISLLSCSTPAHALPSFLPSRPSFLRLHSPLQHRSLKRDHADTVCAQRVPIATGAKLNPA